MPKEKLVVGSSSWSAAAVVAGLGVKLNADVNADVEAGAGVVENADIGSPVDWRDDGR